MSERLMKARAVVRAAEQLAEQVLREDYPAGGFVRWLRNGAHQGTVMWHGVGDRIRVKNAATGKSLWITAGDICRAPLTAGKKADAA
jgi:hypothetical protein